ncbi:hypothetical protein [Mesorhizobium sp. M6A.T.Cr.TU.016.01.1.1]|uniref:hypothetical protein n=1 Tax=Mesorhizobium sp. M6A.T.Cr.TU.016.01.1.1 TaxID=2493677 RepID=UPI000F765B78|nr:hypothetical protein [Mesorhizobium sp. M6A.T.Cr.TU.016.01.1.1]AZO67699.1 hypothetical protein EJ075_24105 [Mesorhizobium sp. M6A.T.Cr.TU.016.01.1.1]
MPNAIYENGDSGVEVDPTLASGLRGHHGWSMVTALVADGERRVRQLIDWTGGEGIKPDVGGYLGQFGLVADIAEATDDRGPKGEAGEGEPGPQGKSAYQVAVDNGFVGTEVEWLNFYVNDIAAAATSEAIDARDIAVEKADAAEGSETNAADSAALAAAAVGGVIYDTMALGIAATTNGQFFIVKGDGVATYALMYKNAAGVATLIASYPSKAGLDASVAALAALMTEEATYYIDGKRVVAGFRDDNFRFPVAVFPDGSLYLKGYVPASELPEYGGDIEELQDILIEPADYYIDGKKVASGFRDDNERFPIAVFDDGSAYVHGYNPNGDPEPEPESPATSGAVYGDSLTANGFAAALGTALGRTVNNRGIGSQVAQKIAARQGGHVLDVTIGSNQIVSGSNSVTHFNNIVSTVDGDTLPLSTAADNVTRTMSVVIAGVAGTLQRSAGGGVETYTFTPAADQTVPVQCPPRTPMFVKGSADTDRSLIQVIWAGMNGAREVWATDEIPTYVTEMVDKLIRFGNNKFVVMGLPNGEYPVEYVGGANYADINTLNRNLAKRFPDNFFDTRRWLIDHGLTALGITPVPGDQNSIDIGRDITPVGLRVDNRHLSPACNTVLGVAVAAFITGKGW